MLLFRSEEHVHRWLEQTGHPFGALIGLQQLQPLGDEWYRDKATLGYRRKTIDEAHATFARYGLTGPFWRLQ